MSGLKAVFYSRESTPEQIETSEARQLLTNTQYAKRIGADVVRRYADLGTTGVQMGGREQLDDLLRDAENRLFNVVIVESVSRLARNRGDTFQVYKTLANNCVELHESTGGKLDLVTLAMKAYVAETERKQMLASSRLGKNIALRKGKSRHATTPNYGYFQETGQSASYVQHPQRAPIVRWIFEETASGVGPTAIAAALTDRREPTPADCLLIDGGADLPNGPTAWSELTISLFLLMPIYSGLLVNNRYIRERDPSDFNKTQHKDAPFEDWTIRYQKKMAIVDRELWLRVQSRLDQRQFFTKSALNRSKPSYLLRGKGCCDHCGSALYAVDAGKYRCSGYCSKLGFVDACRLEGAVFGNIAANLENDVLKHAIAQFGSARPAGLSSTLRSSPQATQAALAKEMTEIDSELDQGLRDVARGREPSPLTLEHWKRLEARVQDIKEELVGLGESTRPRASGAADDMKGLLEGFAGRGRFAADDEVSRWIERLVRGVVDRVRVSKEARLMRVEIDVGGVVDGRAALTLASSIHVHGHTPDESRKWAEENCDLQGMSTATFPKEGRAALSSALSDASTDPATRRRLGAVLRCVEGETSLTVATSVGVEERTVLAWLHLARTRGCGALAGPSVDWASRAATDVASREHRLARRRKIFGCISGFLAGRSHEELADEFGTTLPTVHLWLVRFERCGVDANFGKFKQDIELTPKMIERLETLIDGGRDPRDEGAPINHATLARVLSEEFGVKFEKLRLHEAMRKAGVAFRPKNMPQSYRSRVMQFLSTCIPLDPDDPSLGPAGMIQLGRAGRVEDVN